MIGEVCSGYKLTQKLGEGGTGETYLAEHESTGQQAAVKMLFAQLCGDAEILARFFADVKAASLVNHVGIADLYACGLHKNGRAFVAQELLEGKTLTDSLVELGSVSDSESLADIAWQLATILAAAHGAKLVHGALKPDAVFLTFPAAQAGRPLVKLLDFGMAKFTLSVRHSQTGSLLGAPLYMSPESARGLGQADHRADIYSLGCILFELACGRPPFVREGKGELLVAHASETPPSVASLEPSLPQAIDTLIGRMLTKTPATRPPNMAEVAAVFEKFFACPQEALAASASAQASAPVAYPAAPAPPSPSPPAAASAAALYRQDPTALLPPEPSAPSPRQTWLARVQQRTAIFAPPDAVRLVPGSGRRMATPSLGSHRALPRGRGHPPAPRLTGSKQASSISLPIVIATASVVLAVGAGILIVRGRRPAPPPDSGAAAATGKPPPAREDPVPRARLAEPAPSPSGTGPAPLDEEPDVHADKPSPAEKHGPGSKAKPAPRRPAKRW